MQQEKAFVRVQGFWSQPAWSQAIFEEAVGSVECVKVIQSQFDRLFQKVCLALKHCADIILQLLLIGFSVKPV